MSEEDHPLGVGGSLLSDSQIELAAAGFVSPDFDILHLISLSFGIVAWLGTAYQVSFHNVDMALLIIAVGCLVPAVAIGSKSRQ